MSGVDSGKKYHAEIYLLVWQEWVNIAKFTLMIEKIGELLDWRKDDIE